MPHSYRDLSDGDRGALRRHERMAWLLSIAAIELFVVVELILEARQPDASRFFVGVLFGAATILLVSMAMSRGLLAEAATSLRGREAARLDGARLAGRTLEHHLGNQLALTVGYTSLLMQHPSLDPELRPLAEQALRGAEQATEAVRRMQQIARLEPAPSPPGLGEQPILDLDRSVAG